jgi:hypothetical protein
MPNPTAPPPPKAQRELPANLDDLVRRAMHTGRVGDLERALRETEAAERPAAPVAVVVEPPVVPEVVAPVEELPPAERLANALTALVEATVAARDADGSGETLAAVERALSAAREAREAAKEPEIAEVEPAEEVLPVRLPRVRLAFGLALGAVPEGFEDGRLATALAIDLPTARQLRLARHARVALRGDDRAALERRAEGARAAGVSACVVDPTMLLAFGPARAVVGVEAAESWRVVDVPIWEERPDPSQLPRGVAVPVTPTLLVPGEVEERSIRAAPTESRWQRSRYTVTRAGGERRVAVLDLHADGRIFRLVEGAVDLRALPGFDPASQRRSLAAFVTLLLERWPDLPVEPRRVCGVSADPRAPDGWAEWEEHSRVCRVLRG